MDNEQKMRNTILNIQSVYEEFYGTKEMNDWISVEKDEPAEDGTAILCCVAENYYPFTAMFKTFHPNSPGTRCWRDEVGNKVYFTHWREQLPKPAESLATDKCEEMI